ncbi:MAG: DUF1501 domain-containing protein [Myxococcota bacterium]
MLTRRQLGVLAAGGLLLPRRARAAPAERRFLFLHNSGGWDTTRVFTPMGADTIATQLEPEATVAEVGGLRFVDHPDRPHVRAFFEAWADRCVLVNGIEVPSVTHERCRQLVMTGRSDAESDDWPTLLAAHGVTDRVLGHLVLAGPAYASRFPSRITRVGDEGQLSALLSGDALLSAGVAPPAERVAALTDAFVGARVREEVARAGRGAPAELAAAYAAARDKAAALAAYGDTLSLTTTDLGCERDVAADCALAFDAFSLDAARCAMLRYNGWCDTSWDTHNETEPQSLNFDELFRYLGLAMEDLATRLSPSGAPLLDELVLVVFSEMGRAPVVNAYGGKDHWTYTSALLVGGGLAGGRVIGGLDASGHGMAVDLASGELDEGGTLLTAKELGATLLALGDVDPGEWTDGEPIGALS